MTLLGIAAWGSMVKNPRSALLWNINMHFLFLSLIRYPKLQVWQCSQESHVIRNQHSYVIDIFHQRIFYSNVNSWNYTKYEEIGGCAGFSILVSKLSLRVFRHHGMSHQFNCAAWRNVWRELVNFIMLQRIHRSGDHSWLN